MTVRLKLDEVLPEALQAMIGLEKVVHKGGLDPQLVELVKIRASQLNRCARCLEMHTEDARAIGIDQEKLDLVAAWPEASCFDERERAALAWCEALTLVAEAGAPDDVYQRLAAQLDAREIAVLTVAISAINVWNRLNVGMGATSGGYVSNRRPPAG
jgi:AhpD family alkylhydroperoxidase